jgi:hypothetical protein
MRIAGFRALFVVVASAHAQKYTKPNVHVPAQWSQPVPALPSNDLETASPPNRL